MPRLDDGVAHDGVFGIQGQGKLLGPLLDINEDAWDRIMALNVKGYLLAAQRAARAMATALQAGPRERRWAM